MNTPILSNSYYGVMTSLCPGPIGTNCGRNAESALLVIDRIPVGDILATIRQLARGHPRSSSRRVLHCIILNSKLTISKLIIWRYQTCPAFKILSEH